ncbi:MAG: lipopolysaccharide biosynthesis protein [Marinilabiliaceae bacterium]|nr:lipopolysaccharide biosynthesis protein [Marinilabiliaceae bacterium]
MIKDSQQANKKILVNTMILYAKILITTGISLYSTRLVLMALGVVDYGIYGVVGSVVTSFAFLNAAMTSASQRFFAFELGRNNEEQLKKTFNVILIIFIALSIIVLILAETLGLWFFYNKLDIPAERMSAAFWVFQFAILTFIVTTLKIPYDSVIIARENMRIYAGITILDAVLKLIMILFLLFIDYDKLQLYAILIFCSTFIVVTINKMICNRKYKESLFSFAFDKKLFKTIFSYSGWNLFGALTWIFNNQGINILLNIFFGPAINAARAIAYQIDHAIVMFSQNFYMALNPQIIKSYSTKELNRTFSLVFSGSKIAFYLLLFFFIPLILETRFILELWLGVGSINEYMVIFTRLVLIFSLINVLEGPLTQIVRATGNLKFYQIIVGSFTLMIIPISYILYRLGYPEHTAFLVLSSIYFITTFVRLGVLKKMVNFPVNDYLLKVLLIILVVSITSVILPVAFFVLIHESIMRFFIVSISSFLSVFLVAYFWGINKSEKQLAISFLQSKKFIK